MQPARNPPQESRRVLFIEYGVAFGGAVISMSELINSFTASGEVQPTVLTSLPEEIVASLLTRAKPVRFSRPVNYMLRDRVRLSLEASPLPRVLKKLGLKVYALVDELASYWYAMRLVRIIRANNIDIVHINNGFEADAVRAARWAGKRCIVHCRGLVDSSFHRIINSNLITSGVSKVIAISGAVAESLREQGVPAGKIQMIHNPIEWQKYSAAQTERDVIRDKWGIKSADVVVSIFGRVTSWKGQFEFLEAVRSVIIHCPDMRVMVVGDASDDVHGYSKRVEKLADSDPLRGRVIFAGYQKDVPGYYWSADIVVHNSVTPEPFGRVVTEAMACGRAMIAMKEGGPVDIIEDGYDGILVAPRDTPALAQAIKSLYDSQAERARLGENARRSVQEKFDSDAIARKVLEVYEAIM